MIRTILVLCILSGGVFLALRRGPFWALLLYLWIAYFRPETWLWSDFLSGSNFSFIAGAYVVLATLLSGQKLVVNTQVLLIGLLLVQSSLSTIVSENAAYCWPYWKDFVKAATIAFLIACYATDAARFRLILLTISLSLGFEAVKQGWAQLLLNPGALNANEVPFLGDNNGVAVGMLMLVALFTALARTSTNKWERRFHRFATVGTVYRAISTYSRGGFVACGALAIMSVFRARQRVATLAGMAVAAAIVFSVLPDAFWERMATIQASDEERDRSAAGRLHFWEVALVMANDRPLTGVGHCGYNASYDRYDFSHGEYGKGRSVHSSHFGILAELGYPGFLLFGASLAMALRTCWRARRLAREGTIPAELGEYATALESALVVACVGGAFVIFQYTEMLWHVIGLVAGLDAIVSRAPVTARSAWTSGSVAGPGRAGAAPRSPAGASMSARISASDSARS